MKSLIAALLLGVALVLCSVNPTDAGCRGHRRPLLRFGGRVVAAVARGLTWGRIGDGDGRIFRRPLDGRLFRRAFGGPRCNGNSCR